jgi:cytochrome P450
MDYLNYKEGVVMAVGEDLVRLPIVQSHALEIAPAYRELQEERPVTRVRTAVGDVAWMFTRHEHVKALFSDDRLGHAHADPANAPRFSDSVLLGGPMGDRATEEDMDRRMRGLLAPAFSPRRMRALQSRVDDLVGTLLDRMAGQAPPIDLHQHLSQPLPVMVICELLGVPYEDHELLETWSLGAAGFTDLDATATAFGGLVEYVKGIVDKKRAGPGDDLISDLIAASEEWSLTDDDIAALVALLLFAGHESTVVRIDLGTVLFLANPDQIEALRRDPSLITTAAEEVVRMAAPGDNGMPRYAYADIEIGGVTIHPGEAVILAGSVANRDRRVFDNPDRFDIARKPNPHIGFGHGARFCLGATLARIELRAVFGALFERFEALELAVPLPELKLRNDLLTGGLAELPVRW